MYCGNTIANGFGGMLAAGILSGLDGAGGLASIQICQLTSQKWTYFFPVSSNPFCSRISCRTGFFARK
jgi:hypothetical protein